MGKCLSLQAASPKLFQQRLCPLVRLRNPLIHGMTLKGHKIGIIWWGCLGILTHFQWIVRCTAEPFQTTQQSKNGRYLSHLEVHPVQTLVLLVELGVHVLRHGLQVGEDPSHRLQVLLHLVLSGVVVDPVDHGAVRLHGAAAVATAGLLRHCPAALAAAGPLCVTFPLRVCVAYPPVPEGDMFVSLR